MFATDEIALVETFAQQAAIAIKNVRLFNETKETLQQQTAISEILRLIASSPGDVQPMLAAVAERALRLCDAAEAGIFLVEGDMLRFAAGYGGMTNFEAGNRLPMRRTLVVGRAVLDRTLIHIPDIVPLLEKEYPDARPNQEKFGFRALLAVPLMREDRAIGAIALWRMESRPFTETQIALVKTFADQSAIAIENVRLFNETREALDQQTAISEILRVISSSPGDVQPMLNAVAERALTLCGAAEATILLVEGDLLRFAAGFGNTPTMVRGEAMPISRGSVTGRAVVDRKVIHLEDLASAPEDEYPIGRELQRRFGHHAILSVPLMREDRAIGAIALWRMEARGFTDKQIALVKTFADQAAIAIENVRLFDETKEALEQQTAVAEVLRVIAGSPADMQPVLDVVAERALNLCGAAQTVIGLVEGENLRFVAKGTETFPTAVGDVLPLSRGLVAGRAILDTATVHVEDIARAPEDEYPAGRDLQRRLGHHTTLAVPLMREGHAIGAIGLWRMEVHPFSEKQVALVETFARQAAIAIENVRLFDETKEALEKQTATSEILRVISGSPTTTTPVFEAIAERATRLCDANQGFVHTFDGEMIGVGASYGVDRKGTDAIAAHFPMRLDRKAAVSEAIRSGTIVQIPDVLDVAGYEMVDAAAVANYRGTLSVPMRRDGQVVGAITVTRAEPGRFSDKQIDLLTTFASQAVIAIENVRLFNATKEALDQQRAAAEVLAAISNSIADTQPVFDKILESCERLFAGRMVGIRLVGDDGQIRIGALITARAGAGGTICADAGPTTTTARARDPRRASVQHFPDVEHDEDAPRGPVRRG